VAVISRQKRIEAIQQKADDLVSEIDELVDDMETGLENMPPNLRESSRAESIQQRIYNLQGWSDSLQEIVDDVI